MSCCSAGLKQIITINSLRKFAYGEWMVNVHQNESNRCVLLNFHIQVVWNVLSSVGFFVFVLQLDANPCHLGFGIGLSDAMFVDVLQIMWNNYLLGITLIEVVASAIYLATVILVNCIYSKRKQ